MPVSNLHIEDIAAANEDDIVTDLLLVHVSRQRFSEMMDIVE